MTDNPVTLIDPENWERAGQYRLFSTYARPQYAMTARVEVTRLLTVLKPAGVKPAIACMYALGHASNVIPAFRHRLREDGMVAEYSRADISSTVALPVDWMASISVLRPLNCSRKRSASMFWPFCGHWGS